MSSWPSNESGKDDEATFAAWTVTVSPEGELQLPRHLKPEDADDFVNVVLAAAKVSERVKAIGEADDRLPVRAPLRVPTRPGEGFSQEVRRSVS